MVLRDRLLIVALVVAGLVVLGLQRSAPAPGLPPPPPLTKPPKECARLAAENGSDSGPGTWRRPFRTAQRLVSSLRRGETGCLRRGTYTASGSYLLETWKSNFTLRSYPGERALLKGIVKVHSGTNVRFSSLNFEGTGGENAIVVYGAKDFVLEDSDVTNAWRGKSCMSVGNAKFGVAVRPVIRRNRFHECGDLDEDNQHHGIYAHSTVEGLITENVFYGMAAYAVHLYPNTHRTVVSHNVIDGAAPSVRGGIIFGGDDDYASSGNVVEQNVIAYSVAYNLAAQWEDDAGSGNVARSNCVWAGGLGDIEEGEDGVSLAGNVVADPLFVNRSERDYRLQPGSQCLAVVGYDTVSRLSALARRRQP